MSITISIKVSNNFQNSSPIIIVSDSDSHFTWNPIQKGGHDSPQYVYEGSSPFEDVLILKKQDGTAFEPTIDSAKKNNQKCYFPLEACQYKIIVVPVCIPFNIDETTASGDPNPTTVTVGDNQPC